MERPRAPSPASHGRHNELSSRGASSITDTTHTTSISAWASGLCIALVIVLGFAIYMMRRNALSLLDNNTARSITAKGHDALTTEELRSLNITSKPFRASQHISLGTQDAESGGSTALIPDLQDCSICAEPYLEGETLRQLPCGHNFHQSCIDPWLIKRSGTCPLW